MELLGAEGSEISKPIVPGIWSRLQLAALVRRHPGNGRVRAHLHVRSGDTFRGISAAHLGGGPGGSASWLAVTSSPPAGRRSRSTGAGRSPREITRWPLPTSCRSLGCGRAGHGRAGRDPRV